MIAVTPRPLPALLCAALLVAWSPSAALEGKDYLKSGKAALDAGRSEEAIDNLTAAAGEFPLLGDYALMYLSEAYHQTGRYGKALEAVRGLIQKYPLSPLLRKARGQEIREAREAGENLGRLFEAYVRDYPSDEDIRLMYGLFLRLEGEKNKADDAFKTLCISAGAAASAACAELGPNSLSSSDLMERAANLMKRYDFRAAERELRRALTLDDGKQQAEITRRLGHALFKQKEYRKAADVFGKAHDLYNRTKALYRAGEREEFDISLAGLLERNDQRAADLLVAVAGDMRREGKVSEALASYRDILKRYPAASEDALWGIGWTAYRCGDYRKAADTFLQLQRKHDDPRYLYWQARSLERLGEQADSLYDSLAKIENNFYASLARQRRPGTQATTVQAEPAAVSPDGQQRHDRIDALLALGFGREAIAELAFLAHRVDSPGELYYVIAKFHELGEFRRSVRLASRLPYSEKLHRFSYPLAFWDDVEKAAGRHQVDPLLALSVMREESRFDTDARSVAGARGLMQLMPQTALRLDRHLKLGFRGEAHLHDARTNIQLGVYYLKSLLQEFNSLSHALAAYNAGEAAVRRWEKESPSQPADEFIEDIPYVETRNYVKKVLTSYFQYRKSMPAAVKEAGILSSL